ncbi:MULTISPECIES: tetratricopeptide repeat protein [Alteromonadaceae]|uniref:tetratricopeptide repeat protein n=1 Tax=Alteromonadaceae TaxID=72275 RepID=UPI001C09FE73|nr:MULTISPECIES: tetratricopeptide repeat protein [Aliiglaciecola]MBU2879315.1 sel1 repeat family protein [Aliiglaciecola lipolytica]MDO6709767.1 tetratricopeptide repeat protein [Aliiglaciecola sp. 2_MG-2023]MDO6750691.1 tetratricopeptide repeat protein [Aliiglaciecola sp. 1_MG-2023]
MFVQLRKILLIVVTVTVTPLSIAFDFSECSEDHCVKTFKEFKKYSKKGHPSAMETLGNFYVTGYGTDKDNSRALRMYKKAAKWNQATAQYKAGLMYISGATDDDPSKGISYLKKAAKNKVYDAAYVLGVVYLEGEIEEKDYDEAREWLELASEHNMSKASYLLGKMYDSQLFGADQQDKSIALYNKAAYKIEAARERLIELNQPLPPGNDNSIERIVVNPQDLQEFFIDQLQILRNTPAPKVGTGSRISGQTCEKMMSCGTLGGEDAQRMHTEVQRAVGMIISSKFRIE